MTSSKHTCLRANSKNTMNLINVTAKVFISRVFSRRLVRKDLAVHVSLSSDSIVKQQVGAGFTPNSETLSIPTKRVGGKNPRSSGEASASAAQWRRRRRWAVYRSRPLDLSTRVLKKLRERGPLSENTTPPLSRTRGNGSVFQTGRPVDKFCRAGSFFKGDCMKNIPKL